MFEKAVVVREPFDSKRDLRSWTEVNDELLLSFTVKKTASVNLESVAPL